MKLHFTIRDLLWLALVAALLPARFVVAEEIQPIDMKKTRESLANRLHSLQNLVIEYKMHEAFSPPPSLVAAVAAANNAAGRMTTAIDLLSEDHLCKFRYLDGRLWLEQHLTEESVKSLPGYEFKDEIHSFFDGGYEQYVLPIQGFKGMGTGIRSRQPKKLLTDPIDLGLGVRIDGDQKWVTSEELKNLPIEITSDGQVSIHKQADTSGRTHTWNFDPQNDYALKQYLVVRNGIAETTVFCRGFHNVGGLTLPNQIDIRRYALIDGQIMQVMQTSFEVTNYQLNSPDNTPESFYMTWPINTGVVDEITGKKHLVLTKPLQLDDVKVPEILDKQKSGDEGH